MREIRAVSSHISHCGSWPTSADRPPSKSVRDDHSATQSPARPRRSGLPYENRGMTLLSDRVVIVTGASRRIAIGAAIVRRLAADGAAILLHSWAPHDAEQPWGADAGGPAVLVDELRAQGAPVGHVAADLADPDAPAALVDAARAAFGHVDAVVANHA